jgi:LuxR family transcriptional regulator, maltose regulon positive regulatory protein
VSTTVLSTKLFAPSRRLGLVARPRLVGRLDAALDSHGRLSLISAPAGFGKTTLVGSWIDECVRRDPAARIAWLSLDKGDNDLPRLLTHMVAALQVVDEGVGSEVLKYLRTASASPVADSLTTLVNDVAGSTGQIVLVLDDYHLIEAQPVHDAVTFLLDHLPPQLHLMIVGRSDPPLPLSRLRTRGELTEFRAADLRFTSEEADSFLNQVMGLDLSASDVDVLEARTEGWIAGLQLAALSLRGRSDVSRFIGGFAGTHRFVLDYLVDEVLQRQSGAVREFLIRTAVLDRLTGPLCDALTGREDGSSMLEDLERANLFVVPLDDQRAWSRYHHLFSDVLRARLRSEEPGLMPTLHGRASDWFQHHGFPEDAVRHALAGRDFDQAVHLIEGLLPQVRRNRQDALLVGWLDALPDESIRGSAVLSVFYGWKLMVSGELDAVEERLDDAERAIAGADADAHDKEELGALPITIAVYRASLAQARGDLPAIALHAQRALDMAEPDDHFSRGAAGGFLGLAAWATGDIEVAVETFSAAVANLRAAGNVADALTSTVVLADMWVVAGRPDRARGLLEAALHTATEESDHPGAVSALPIAGLHVGVSELDLERGDLAAAVHHLEAAERLGEHATSTENRGRWLVAMGRLREVTGDPEGALELLAEAEVLYRRGFLPEVRPIPAVKARIGIGQAKLAEATDWARGHDVSTADDPSYLREFEHLTLVRLLIAQHRSDPGRSTLRDAVGLLDRLHEAASRTARAGSLLEIQILQALAHEAQGDATRALDVLEEALEQSPAPGAYRQLFLDEGRPLISLLRRAGDLGRLGPHPRRLLHSGAAAAVGEPVTLHPNEASLTQRELRVLALLDSALTGPEIAREMFVTLNTLRTHTKRIFTKLDVNNRAAAVRRGHERGLL